MAVSGSVTSAALTANTSFTLSCSGAGGTITSNANVAVTTATTTVPTGTSTSKPIAAASIGSGFTNLRITSTTDQGALNAPEAAFRVPCGYSHMAFDDPIVFPGQPGASHLHTFFGNTSTTANSDTASLTAAASSTCAGGTANLTSYWMPAMIDTTTNRALIPSDNLVYYKSAYKLPSSIQAPPKGLRIIAGNKVTQSTALEKWVSHYEYVCSDAQGTELSRGQFVPVCPVGGKFEVQLLFPDCWDGVNLDSPDHRSHMVYSADYGSVCPADHPVGIPLIGLNVTYTVGTGQNTATWRLSSDGYDVAIPGGLTTHGDIWVDWDDAVEETWIQNCIQANKDCHAYLLGDGRMLY